MPQTALNEPLAAWLVRRKRVRRRRKHQPCREVVEVGLGCDRMHFTLFDARLICSIGFNGWAAAALACKAPLSSTSIPSGYTRNAFLADVILISQATYEHCSPLMSGTGRPQYLIVGNDDVAQMLEGYTVQTLRPGSRSRPARRASRRCRGASGGPATAASAPAWAFSFRLTTTTCICRVGAIAPRRRSDQAGYRDPAGAQSRSGLMSIDTAVEVVRKLRPRWVIPSHWSPANGGGYLDVKAFQAALAGLAEVVIPGEAATAAAV